MTTTSKPTVRKGSGRGRAGDDWDRAYVESFVDKYCRDTPTADENAAESFELEVARMTERERIIAQELTAKLEAPEPQDELVVCERAGVETPTLVLVLLAVLLALASGVVLLLR